MACDIITTPGAVDATGYADIPDSDAYHEAHISLDVWDGFSDEQQCRALKMATRLLDQWYDWDGVTASADQALLWPRVGAVGPNGYQEPSDAIPTRIVEGTCELARYLLVDGDVTVESDVTAQKITRVKAGSVEVEFSGTASSKTIPDSVASMVSCYGQQRSKYGSAGAVTMLRA